MSPLSVVPPRGARAVLATALCAVATCASLTALGNLLSPGPWKTHGWLAVVAVAGVVAAVRAVARTSWVPTLVGAVVAFLGLLVRYGGPPGRVRLLPELASWDRLTATWGDGMEAINSERVPMDVTTSTELVLVVGAIGVFLLADLMAVGLSAPAWAGVVLALMWLPTVALGFGASWSALFWAGAAYLLLLALSVAPRGVRDDDARRGGAATVASVGLLVATLVLAPVVAAVPGWSAIGLPNLGGGGLGPVSLSDELDVRQSLGDRSGQAVLRYVVEAPGENEEAGPTPGVPAVNANTVGPLRALTVTSFDGRTWHPDDVDLGDSWTQGDLVTSDPRLAGREPSDARGTLARVAVEVGVLRDRHLPVSTFPRTLAVDGTWRYDSVRDQFTGSSPTYEGMEYTMTVEAPELTAEDLRNAAIDYDVDPAALEVPDTEHREDIEALVRDLTDGAATPYEMAMALQSYLRSAANFEYETRIEPGRTDDAVWDFLQSGKGYCVQFATAMAVMARIADIPSRIGVGFLPGRFEDDAYVVTGRQSHAWPELHFEGYGWVRFEPTPAVQSGAPPIWSDPFANVSSTQGPGENLIPTGGPQTPGVSQPGTGSGAGAGDDADLPWFAIGATLVLVLGAATATLLFLRRRAAVWNDPSPERAWTRLRRRLEKQGVGWSDATTPRDVVESVRAQVDERGGRPLPDEADAALVSLARAVERARYAPRPPEVAGTQLSTWVEQVMTGVEQVGHNRSRSQEHAGTHG